MHLFLEIASVLLCAVLNVDCRLFIDGSAYSFLLPLGAEPTRVDAARFWPGVCTVVIWHGGCLCVYFVVGLVGFHTLSCA